MFYEELVSNKNSSLSKSVIHFVAKNFFKTNVFTDVRNYPALKFVLTKTYHDQQFKDMSNP